MADSNNQWTNPNTNLTNSQAGGLGGLAGSVLGGIIGNSQAAGDTANADAMAQKGLQALLALGYPPSTAQAILLKQYQQAGTLTPQLENAINSGPSAVAGITEDPQLRAQQIQALNLMSQRATGGLNAQDMANFNQMRSQLASDQNAKQQQIIQQAQMRGQSGGGAELASALQSEQSGANQASAAGDRLAATASQNALQAASNMGNMSGQARAQDFGVNQARANATDQMNRFNVQNQIAQQQRNVGAQNQAQQYNLNNQQNISNANIGMGNQELYRQNQAAVNDWRNKMGYAGALNQAYGSEADRLGQRAHNTSNMWGSIGGGVGTVTGALGNSGMFSGGGMVPGNSGNGGTGDQGTAAASGFAGSPDLSDLAAYSAFANKGGIVPGKAKFAGDHPENDTVHAMLSPGEIVIPKHIADSEDAPVHAMNYVHYLKKLKEQREKK